MAYNSNNIHQWHFRHDALEALNSFAVARNLFFCVTVVCLLVIQGVFISVNCGMIDSALDIPVCQTCNSAECESPDEQARPADEDSSELESEELNDSDSQVEREYFDTDQLDRGVNSVNEIKLPQSYAGAFIFCRIVDDFKISAPAQPAGPDLLPDSSDTLPAEQLVVPKVSESKEVVPDSKLADTDDENEAANAKLVRKTLASIVKVADIVIVFAIVMYGISLFICIQLSLVGSLGGLASSTKAFFSAMLAILILLPWTRAFYPEAPSMLFSFNELVTAYLAKINGGDDNYIMVSYYGRFCAMWLVILLLIVMAQWRSFSAARQIANRITEWKEVNPFDVPACANVPVKPIPTFEPVKSESQGPIPLE